MLYKDKIVVITGGRMVSEKLQKKPLKRKGRL